ncbi:SCO family protein [Alicyclobacillus cycloheptanicus]|uniref:Protein SCO1/2 n=1 Tax=Alicyclobacillus cycloheptanicus TaxID=1457 RepID=A0ABT9XH94_9BACL|nr:SCO family protein [Alicyclobacillus cycloheptanicus]MDQ0189682.1 protein SCO1/2 [Alicyclobacillus cycloheptanicus]WDL99979.1 SCO family protein [Alicyclobacillus cycloheptanicus]
MNIALRFIRRQWLTFLTVATFFGICCGGITLHALKGTSAQSLPMEGKAYNFFLVNSNGNRVTLGDSAGKVRLVAFIYTRCNASCPVVTSEMVQLQKGLERQGIMGNHVELISITMDPAHDTESVLRSYEKQFGVAPVGWEFLTGTQQAIDQTLKQYGIYVKKVDATQYVHTIAEFLIDGQGNIRKVYGLDISETSTENDIESLLHSE